MADHFALMFIALFGGGVPTVIAGSWLRSEGLANSGGAMIGVAALCLVVAVASGSP